MYKNKINVIVESLKSVINNHINNNKIISNMIIFEYDNITILYYFEKNNNIISDNNFSKVLKDLQGASKDVCFFNKTCNSENLIKTINEGLIKVFDGKSLNNVLVYIKNTSEKNYKVEMKTYYLK